MLNLLYQIASEIVLVCIYPITSISMQFVPQNELSGHGDGKTIVIVERWLSINFMHLYWKYYLEKKGFRVYLINFPLWYKDFNNSAERLSKYLIRHNLSNITIVGISSGALTSLLYLQEHNGWERVNRLISVGTPFKGTWSALFLFFLFSGRELLPNSPFMQKVASFNIYNRDRIICIRAKFDEMVPTGSILPGAKRITIKAFGHNNLHIRVRQTYRKIIEFVE